MDVRIGKWYGDETKGNNYCIPGYDFYNYFGIQKGESGMKGIDISAHNGKIDFEKVKASGIQFVIARAGLGKYEKQKDTCFEANYAGAKAAGIPFGAYWYSYAVTPDEAAEEARVCIEVLKGKQYEMPIWFDQEEKASLDTGKANCSAMVRAFCAELEKAGYFAGLYTSRAFLQTHIEDDIKSRYALWIAEWGDKLNYSGAVGIWQTGTCKVDGITGEVDADICYQDYPARIKAKGLNGFGKQETKPPVTETAKEIPFEMTFDGKKYAGVLKQA